MSKLPVGKGWLTDQCVDCTHQVQVGGGDSVRGYRCTEFKDPQQAELDRYDWCTRFETRARRA